MNKRTVCYCGKKFPTNEDYKTHIKNLESLEAWNDHLLMHCPVITLTLNEVVVRKNMRCYTCNVFLRGWRVIHPLKEKEYCIECARSEKIIDE